MPAFPALAIAARTGPELAEIFLLEARGLDQTELADLVRAVPAWVANLEGYALAMDFSVATLGGRVINCDIRNEQARRAP